MKLFNFLSTNTNPDKQYNMVKNVVYRFIASVGIAIMGILIVENAMVD